MTAPTKETKVDIFAVPDLARWLDPNARPRFPLAMPDPTGYWRKKTPDMTLEAVAEFVGLIPEIFHRGVTGHLIAIDSARAAGVALPEADPSTTALLGHVISAYGFPNAPMTGGEVGDTDGVYRYPEDPDLYPLVALRHPLGAQCLIYEYGITAVRFRDTGWQVVRLD